MSCLTASAAGAQGPPTESATPATRPSITASFLRLAATQGQNPPPKKVFRWDDHPAIHLGIVEIAFKARIRLDAESSEAPIGDLDEVTSDIDRKRVGIEGSIGKYAEYQVEYEFGDELDPWRDVYLNYSQFDQIQFQFGKFKQPFGLDENTSPANLDFAYRSLIASTIAPGRDIGYMVHGRLFDRILRYEFGKFEHDGRQARPKEGSSRVYGGETVAGRISAVPFRPKKSPADDFEIGIAWTSTEIPEGFSGIRGKTVFDQTFFSNDYLVLGRRKRLGFETRWRPGPFSIQSEYSRVTDERLGQSVEDTDLSLLRGHGWYLSGSWAITGDAKKDGLNAPKRPLGQGGIGAVEVAARIERLTFDSMAEPNGSDPSTSIRADVILGNSEKILTFGANWYVNRWIKIQFNVIKETLTDPEQGPLPEASSFWSKLVKFQFSL